MDEIFNKIWIIFITSFLVFNLLLINPETLDISGKVRATRYSCDTNLSYSDASIGAKELGMNPGGVVSGAGDVNGDGYDDILIGNPAFSKGGKNAGKVMLIFGGDSGWSKDMDNINVGASFIGERVNGSAGYSVAGAGDVNGDGYDDFLIGEPSNNYPPYFSGEVYLFLGKSTGWSQNTSLSSADASFEGEFWEYNLTWGFNVSDQAGYSVAGAGDVNGDGYDDFIISSCSYYKHGHQGGKVYIIFGRAAGWEKNVNLSRSNASFVAIYHDQHLGKSIASAVDINNDDYDDILISGREWNVSFWQDKIYIIFGKSAGWENNISITNADASFVDDYDNAGFLGSGIAGTGDLNGDGIDDFVAGAPWCFEGGVQAGQTYVIFGKTSGWYVNASIAEANASFLGTENYAHSGYSVAGGGDVNGDGYNDFIIGAPKLPDGKKQKEEVYLILGRSEGWSMDIKLTEADASFEGESPWNWIAFTDSITIPGDINGDGFDDILIGAYYHPTGGKAYFIFPRLSYGPESVYSVKAYSDVSYTKEINIADIGDFVYVELVGSDKNATHTDNAAVDVTSELSSPAGIRIYLTETGKNTGRYRGWFRINNLTHPLEKFIHATLKENITVSSVTDPAKQTVIFVDTPIKLKSSSDASVVDEDGYYYNHYWNFGYGKVSDWTFDTNATWLNWDAVNHDLNGMPDNTDVGKYWVSIAIKDLQGNFDSQYFTIDVKNTPPEISTENINLALEDETYFNDYDCTDDGQGAITWHLATDADWLVLDNSTGELEGTPTNDNRGQCRVNVSVSDGNGGMAWSDFTLIVADTNDEPVIITSDITSVNEDDYYSVDYDAYDIDGDTDLIWSLQTNASWLNIEQNTGMLVGTPLNEDVGRCYINVTVSDQRHGTDSHNFTLDVINTNDPPLWIFIPPDTELNESEDFRFDIDALDVDRGDSLTYDISHGAPFEIILDNRTGLIEGTAALQSYRTSPLEIKIEISVTDGRITIWDRFNLIIIPNPRPTVNLVSPPDKSRVGTGQIGLSWTGFDEWNEVLAYDLYIGKDMASVIKRDNSTLFIQDLKTDSFNIDRLDAGSVYYWTVIPFDGLHNGDCANGFFSFAVNSPPTIPEIPIQTARVGVQYLYDINAQDVNLDDILLLKYHLDAGPEGMTIDSETGIITWFPSNMQIGEHKVKISVTDGFDNTNITFDIAVIEPPESEQRNSQSILITSASISIILIILSIFIAGTEVGKYKFFSAFVVPLYNILQPDKIFDNYIRGQIHGYIKAKPGEHYNAIKTALKLNNGTLSHHAKILEKEGYIYTKNDGFYTRFYPINVKSTEPDMPKFNETQKNIIKLISENPGITQTEIVGSLNVSQPYVSKNLTYLVRDNIVKIKPNGREKKYYLDDIKQESLINQLQNGV